MAWFAKGDRCGRDTLASRCEQFLTDRNVLSVGIDDGAFRVNHQLWSTNTAGICTTQRAVDKIGAVRCWSQSAAVEIDKSPVAIELRISVTRDDASGFEGAGVEVVDAPASCLSHSVG